MASAGQNLTQAPLRGLTTRKVGAAPGAPPAPSQAHGPGVLGHVTRLANQSASEARQAWLGGRLVSGWPGVGQWGGMGEEWGGGATLVLPSHQTEEPLQRAGAGSLRQQGEA